MPAPAVEAIEPAPVASAPTKRPFVRGRKLPPVPWFQIRWLRRDKWHLIASAFAKRDIDARDWMTPDRPEDLLGRIAAVLGAESGGDTLAERLGRDVILDYVADTGDDFEVSAKVADLMVRPVRVRAPGAPPGAPLEEIPRGDVLLFGGDTAYPVATHEQIRERLIKPWNEVLARADDGRRRVMLGLPGNHDWNDGTDGFTTLFRAALDETACDARRPRRPKPALHGYTAVQNATYFFLPLAPRVPLLAVDRQLGRVDYRQRHHFRSWLSARKSATPIVMQAEPVRAFGRPTAEGAVVSQDLALDYGRDASLVLAGDIHHYHRWVQGPTTHVTAGGGGAALHPVPIAERDLPPPQCEAQWPDGEECRKLLADVPYRLGLFQSGLLVHTALALAALLVLLPAAWWLGHAGVEWGGAVLGGALLIGAVAGLRRPGRLFALVAITLVTAVVVGLLPAFASRLLLAAWPAAPPWAGALAGVVLVTLLGALAVGFALSAFTRFGVQHTIAYASLAHPGFKHFLRLRVRADGSAVDVWCIGLRNPLALDEPPLLVDAFSWRPARE